MINISSDRNLKKLRLYYDLDECLGSIPNIHIAKILIILGPFLTIENFCLITEINTAPAGSSLQGYYETGL